MGAHARFSPSSSNRYLNCPPALWLEEQFEDEQSPYAAEGSAGHRMAEYLINKHLKRRDKRPVSDYYSDELLEAVDDYVLYVMLSARLKRQNVSAVLRCLQWSREWICVNTCRSALGQQIW